MNVISLSFSHVIIIISFYVKTKKRISIQIAKALNNKKKKIYFRKKCIEKKKKREKNE